jgi:hypothetical protein
VNWRGSADGDLDPSAPVVAIAGLVLVTAAAALLATGGADAQEDPVDRVAGENRWSTAGGLADQVDGDTLWVATGFDFADALTAGATGAGPVLLVAGDSAPQATLDGAAGLAGIERVRAVGGPGGCGRRGGAGPFSRRWGGRRRQACGRAAF